MASPAIRYQPPASHLRAFITTYYWVDVPDGDAGSDWLHPEWVNLRFVLSGRWTVSLDGRAVAAAPALLFGPTIRSTEVTFGPPTRVVGVGVMPLGFATFWDADAASLAQRTAPLERVLPDAAGLWERLAREDDPQRQSEILDAFFTGLAAARPRAPELMARAHAALLDPEVATAEAFAEALDVSPRHLRRLCRRLFGFPPKLLLQRQRFLRTFEAMIAARDRPFGEVLDAAYFDQSHFVRDFRRFMGRPPSAYFALERPLLGVAAGERLRALGASFQGLHAERLRMAERGVSVSSKRSA